MSLDVRKLIELGEGQHVEFKTSFSEENDAIETLCAFANSEGGTVLVGISDSGIVVNVSLGKNTLENFANKLHRETEPPLYVSLTSHQVDGKTVVAVSVKAPRQGELFYAFVKPFVRVGRTNQVMSPPEQRERLLAGQMDWLEEKDRPHFAIRSTGGARTETQFQPQWRIDKVSGDYIPTIGWRFRGARLRPPMEWRHASGSTLKSDTFSATFDLSHPPGHDDLVPEGQIGFEIRFLWRGRVRHELHRFPLTRDVGREILPPLYSDE